MAGDILTRISPKFIGAYPADPAGHMVRAQASGMVITLQKHSSSPSQHPAPGGPIMYPPGPFRCWRKVTADPSYDDRRIHAAYIGNNPTALVIIKGAKKPKGWPVPGTGWNAAHPDKPLTESKSTVPVGTNFPVNPNYQQRVFGVFGFSADKRTPSRSRDCCLEHRAPDVPHSASEGCTKCTPWSESHTATSSTSLSYATPRKCFALPYEQADCGARLIPVMGRQIGGDFKLRLLHKPLFKKGYLEGLWYFDETAKWKDERFRHLARCGTMEGFYWGWGRISGSPKSLPDLDSITAGKGWKEPWTEGAQRSRRVLFTDREDDLIATVPPNPRLVAESKSTIGPCATYLRPSLYTPDEIAAYFNRWGRMFPESARYFGLNKRRRDREYGPARYKFGLVPYCARCEPLLPDYLSDQNSQWHRDYLLPTFEKDLLRCSWEYLRHWWPNVFGLLVPENVILKKDPKQLPESLRVGTIANADERLQAYQFQMLGIQFPSKIFECATRFTDLQAERDNESRLAQDDLPANLGRDFSNPDIELSDEDAAAENSERIEPDTEDSSEYLGLDTEDIDVPDMPVEEQPSQQPKRPKRLFTDDQVRVLAALQAGQKLADIAKELGVDLRTAYRIKKAADWILVHEIQRQEMQKKVARKRERDDMESLLRLQKPCSPHERPSSENYTSVQHK